MNQLSKSDVEDSLNQVINQSSHLDLIPEHFKDENLRFNLISNSPDNNSNTEVELLLNSAADLVYLQIPSFGKELIKSTLFDPKYYSLLIVNKKQNDQILGCFTFRPFYEQGFSEICFCAIESNHQIKRFGTSMMNILKDFHISKNLFVLLTYADLKAIRYFEKQEFSERITLPESVYKNRILPCKLSKLMQCRLDTGIKYSLMSKIVELQKKWVQNLIVKQTVEELVRKETIDQTDDLPIQLENICISCKIDGWLFSKSKEILSKLYSHPNSWPFRESIYYIPETPSESVRKVDLDIVSKRLDNYLSWSQFDSDVKRIFSDCYLSNRFDSEEIECAKIMHQYYLYLCDLYMRQQSTTVSNISQC